MVLFFSKVISSIIEIILVTLIPFVWWLITERKHQKFAQWIGIKKISGDKKKTILATASVSVVFILLGASTLYSLRGIETAVSEFEGMRISALPAIFVYAVFNTAFPEELFFRGFLLKRISGKFGFAVGNAVQAILFALLHGIMFISLAGAMKTMLIAVITGAVAYSMGYINEKYADGSIIPGWIIHALSNVFSGICSAFMLI